MIQKNSPSSLSQPTEASKKSARLMGPAPSMAGSPKRLRGRDRDRLAIEEKLEVHGADRAGDFFDGALHPGALFVGKVELLAGGGVVGSNLVEGERRAALDDCSG